eukprot:g2673.t1
MSAFISRAPSGQPRRPPSLSTDLLSASTSKGRPPSRSVDSPRTPRASIFDDPDGSKVAAAVKKKVASKIKAASYKYAGRTPKERLAKMFSKFVRKSGGLASHGLTYLQLQEAMRGLCSLQDNEFDMLWHMLDTDESGTISVEEFMAFLRRDERSEDEFARAVMSASQGRDAWAQAMAGTSPKSSSSKSPQDLPESPTHDFLRKKVHELPAPVWEIGAGRPSEEDSDAVRLAWKPPPLTEAGNHVDGYRVEWRVGPAQSPVGRTLEKAGEWMPMEQAQIVAAVSATEIFARMPKVDLRHNEVRVQALDKDSDWGGWSAPLIIGLPSWKQAENRWLEEEAARQKEEDRRRKAEEEEYRRRVREDAEAAAAKKAAADKKKMEQQKKKAVKKVNKVVEDIKTELLKPDPKPSPEQVKFVTEVGKKFVSPGCSQPSNPAWWGGKGGSPDFESGGNYQVCNSANVATRNHGLQCCNRGHWVCWSCMISGIDWAKALRDNPELFLEQEKEVINDNLEIDASKMWRAGSGGVLGMAAGGGQ